MFNSIKTRFKDWKHARYLNKMGWTQRQYDIINDPDFNPRASCVKDMYHGYQFITEFTNTGRFIIEHDAWVDGVSEMREWCKNNSSHKWRNDFLRVNPQMGIGLDGKATKEWWANEISGGDVLFVAFKNEQDFVWFNLKWR